MAWYRVVVALLALGLAYDMYLRVRARRGARPSSRRDELGGIEDWRSFYERAEGEFERARRYNHPFSLCYFDLDDFTEVSDRFSPEVAEAMLRSLVESARASIRASDVLGRLGSDVFALLLPEASSEAADAVIQKLQQALGDMSLQTALPLTITGAVVTCLPQSESLEAVIGAADRLLSGARSAGKGSLWSEVIAPQPLEGFEPARLRRPQRLPPAFDVPMPPMLRRQRGG
ncbi:MAG TPA: GGDEF domain-containing protein [Gemmatimonadales bacterium]|nr:GGDEF domain-containing protein [Gemmatimonadales bacterium]